MAVHLDEVLAIREDNAQRRAKAGDADAPAAGVNAATSSAQIEATENLLMLAIKYVFLSHPSVSKCRSEGPRPR